MTKHDRVPHFGEVPTIQSTRNGSWTDPSTWTPARLPKSTDVVAVKHDVTYDAALGSAHTVSIEAGGALRFRTNTSTRLDVVTMMVLPKGLLEVGSVFYHEQAPEFVVPMTDDQKGILGAPAAGLSNAASFAKYGIAIAGSVAPCTDSTSRPEIDGFVCP